MGEDGLQRGDKYLWIAACNLRQLCDIACLCAAFRRRRLPRAFGTLRLR